jgi:Txe/YoeB family toxin of Txe-Axe toxin-antitoxin module
MLRGISLWKCVYEPASDAVAVLTYSYLDGERVVKEEIKSKRKLNEQQYSANGSLAYKFIHKLDDRGNEVETVTTRYEDSRDPVQGTTTYKYLEFDSQGNWTRRTESRGAESWMIYRTITYH